MNRRWWIGSSLLLVMVAVTGVSLAAWKYASVQRTALENQPEQVESVIVALAKELADRPTSVSSSSGEGDVRVAVPVKALLRGPGGDHVFVIAPDKDGKPRAYLRQVERGPILDNEVVISAGLSPGERVAASGTFKLRDAGLVAVANESGDGR